MTSEFEKRKTWKMSKRHLKRSHRKFRESLDKRLEQLKPTSSDRHRWKGLVGDAPTAGQLRASDLSARRQYAKYLAKEVRQLARTGDDLKFYHITLLADEGIMSERTPTFRKRLLVRRANRAMAKAGLDGIYVIENQVLTGYPAGGKGKSILAHVHIVAWKRGHGTDNTRNAIKKAITHSQGRRNYAWSCRFGARPVVVKEITKKLGCPSYWIAYIMKAPKDAKNLVRQKANEPESHIQPKAKFRNTIQGYRPEAAMRLFELFAQIPLSSVAHGRGEGDAMIHRSKVRLRLWDARRQAKWREETVKGVEPFDETAFWKRMRGKRQSKFKRFLIDEPTIAGGSTRKRV